MSLWSCNEEAGINDQWGKAVVRIDWRRVMALLESGQGEDVNEIRHGRTILYQAVLDREIVAIAALLRHGADPNFRRWLREIRPVSPRAVRCHAPAQFARSGRRDLRHL